MFSREKIKKSRKKLKDQPLLDMKTNNQFVYVIDSFAQMIESRNGSDFMIFFKFFLIEV